MFEGSKKRERMAEEFLHGAKSPRAPETLRDFGLQRIMARASAESRERAARKYLRHPYRLRRAVAISLLALLFLAGATSGLYAASAGALPGSILYGSKIFFERARLAFTLSPSSDASLELKFCERRMRELREMLQAGGSHDWERWLGEYRRNLSGAEQLLESLPEAEYLSLSAGFLNMLSEHASFLEETSAGAPEEGRSTLEAAREECQRYMMRVRRRRGMEGTGGHPEEGQEKPGSGGAGDSRRQEGPSVPGGPGTSTGPREWGEDTCTMTDGGRMDAPPSPQGAGEGNRGSSTGMEKYGWPGNMEPAPDGVRGGYTGSHAGI